MFKAWVLRISCILAMGAWGFLSNSVLAEGVLAPDARYQQTLERIAQGHWQWAVEELQELIRSDPTQAGARLDLAVLYCQMGSRNQSWRTLSELEALGPLPPGIQAVVDMIRQEDCQSGLVAKQPWVWQVGVGAGYTDNANFGVANRSVPLGSNAPFAALELSAESLPRASSFLRADLQAQGYWDLTGRLLHTWSAGLKHYDQVKDYDTQWLQWLGQVRHEWQSLPIEQRFLLGHLQLNQQHYLTQAGYGQTLWFMQGVNSSQESRIARATTQWRQGVDLWWTHQRYAHVPLNDSWRLEAKYIWEAVGSWIGADKWAVSAGPVLDKPTHQRVGGDRRGWMAQVLLEGRAPAIWTAQSAQWQFSSALQVLREQEPYNFLFDNEKRRPTTWLNSLRWVEAIGANHHIYLQLQHQRQKDPIPLFNYSSWVLEAGYLWR